MAFIGILAYLIVEYTRLAAMYPVLIPLQLGKVVVGVALLGWLVSPRKSAGDRSPVRAIDVALVLLLFGAFVSVLFAHHLDLAWSGYLDFLRLALIYFLLGRILTNSWRLRIFVFLFLLLNLKLAQHAIRYYYETRAYWGEMMAVHEGARGSSGFFGNAGDFGVAMCVVWPLAVVLLFAKLGKTLRLFLLACSTVFLVVIPLSCTRGAAVGAACITLAGIVISRKKLPALVMALLLLLGFLYVMPEASKGRFQSALHDPEADSTVAARLEFWRAGLMMFRDNPILGVGIRNFLSTRLEKYAQPGDTTQAFAPHSIYIEVLSELGLVGMIPFLALVVLFFRLNAKSRKILLALGDERRRSYEYCLSLGLDLALIGYLSSGAFLTVFYYPHLWILLGLSAGLYGACCRIQREATKAEAVPAGRTVQFQLVAP